MPPQVLDITGHRFGRLVAVEQAARRGRYVMWRCKCDCGNDHFASTNHLRKMKKGIRSCGCWRREIMARRNVANARHNGLSYNAEYKSWRAMIARCTLPDDPAYRHYGGRGITVVSRWLRSCRLFLADMGPRPSPSHTLDRIDTNGNYEPGNCRWATAKQQQNNRRNNVRLEHDGKCQTAQQWADELGLTGSDMRSRLRAGCTLASIIDRIRAGNGKRIMRRIADEQVRELRTLVRKGMDVKSASSKFNIAYNTAYNIVRGTTRRSAGGYMP